MDGWGGGGGAVGTILVNPITQIHRHATFAVASTTPLQPFIWKTIVMHSQYMFATERIKLRRLNLFRSPASTLVRFCRLSCVIKEFESAASETFVQTL